MTLPERCYPATVEFVVRTPLVRELVGLGENPWGSSGCPSAAATCSVWQAILPFGGQLMTAFIICLAAANLIRMMLYLVGAGVYMMRRALSNDRARPYQPTVSIVVPVHNEAVVIERTLDHLMKVDHSLAADHPGWRWFIDDTLERIYAYKRAHRSPVTSFRCSPSSPTVARPMCSTMRSGKWPPASW